MKALLLALTALTLTAAHAETKVKFLQVAVDAVKCRSGATVNFEETVSPGRVFDVAELPPEFKLVKEPRIDRIAIFRLEYAIKNGAGYKTNRPPCPLNDVLELDVMIKKCEIRIKDDFSTEHKCDFHFVKQPTETSQ